MSDLLIEARVSLRKQLDWHGPNGKTQGILTLTRAEAEAILAGPIGPGPVLEEIRRLAQSIPKEDIERYRAEAARLTPRP